MTFSPYNLFVALVASCLMCGVGYWLEVLRRAAEVSEYGEFWVDWVAYMKRNPWKRRWVLFGVQIVTLYLAFQVMDWGVTKTPSSFLLLLPFTSIFLGAFLSRPPHPYPKNPIGNEGYKYNEHVVKAARDKYRRHGQYENAWFFGKALTLVTAEMTAVFIVSVFILATVLGPHLPVVLIVASLVTTLLVWVSLYGVEKKTGWLALATGERHPEAEAKIISAPQKQKAEPVIPGADQSFSEIAAEARARADSLPDEEEF